MSPITAVSNIEDQIARDEDLRLCAYQDSLGYWTIGYGRCIDAKVGGCISKGEAELMRANDILRVNNELAAALPWTAKLDRIRFGVLQNMTFNMGIARLLGFKQMLLKLQAGDYLGAAAEMRDSAWHNQVGARSERLALQMEKGEWQ